MAPDNPPPDNTAQTGSTSSGSDQQEDQRPSRLLWFVMAALLVLLAILIYLLMSHRNWSCTLTATPDGVPVQPGASATVVATIPQELTATIKNFATSSNQTNENVAKLLVVMQPKEAAQVVQQPPAAIQPPAPAVPNQPSPEPIPATTQEKPVVYVNIVIVDWDDGVVQFPVFEKVPVTAIWRNRNMTEFALRGKHTVTSARVLESIPYTDDDEVQVGTICRPDENCPKRMIVLRCNQSLRDVYRDGYGLYYKTGDRENGFKVERAPDQATWFARPITPHH